MNDIIFDCKLDSIDKITEEDFVKCINNANPDGIFEKLCSEHNNLSKIAKEGLKLIDPTGLYNLASNIMDYNIADRQQEMLSRSIYRLYIEFHNHRKQMDEYIKNNKRDFTYLCSKYFEFSRIEINHKKINILKDILINGSIDPQLTLDKKSYMMELVSNIKYEQFIILKYIVQQCPVDNINKIDFNNMKPVDIFTYCNEIDMDWVYAKQYCIDMQSRGLLGVVSGLMISADIRSFVPTAFSYKLMELIKSI